MNPIEKAIRDHLVIGNPQSIHYAVKKIEEIFQERMKPKGICAHPNSRGYNQILSYCPDCKRHIEE